MTSENDLSNFTKYTEQQLKKYAKNKLSFPDLEDYIKKQYYHDIYYCFFRSMIQIKKNYRGHGNECVIIDLDETFVQNYYFRHYTFHIWDHSTSVYDIHMKNAKRNFDPILPFMFILYRYCLHKGIKVIFVSGRLEHLRKQTIRHLKFSDVHEYELYLSQGSSMSEKTKIINQIQKKYTILAVLMIKMILRILN